LTNYLEGIEGVSVLDELPEDWISGAT